MDQHTSFSLMADCPHCGKETRINGRALATSGIAPEVYDTCFWCRKPIKITAILDLYVEPLQYASEKAASGS